MFPVRRSNASGTEEGTTDPHITRTINIRDKDKEITYIGAEWHGGGYDEETCWIVCAVDDLLAVTK